MQKRVVVILVGLVLAAVAVARADRAERIPLRTSFAAFPMQVGDWTGVQEAPLTQREIEVLGVSDYLVRAYYLAASARASACTSGTGKASGRGRRSTRRRTACPVRAGSQSPSRSFR